MKKIKMSLVFIVLICFVILIYQNSEYFFAMQSMNIDLKMFESWQWALPELMNIGYLAISFLLGFLIAGYLGVSSKLKSRKIVRQLKLDNNSCHEQILTLKTELDKFHSDPYISDKIEESQEKSPEPAQN